VGETNFVRRSTSVRTALRHRSRRGPLGWFVSNPPGSSLQSSEMTTSGRRTELVRWISDELRRWAKSPVARIRRREPRSAESSWRTSDPLSSN
jgi:hypothetical protein